MHTNKQSARRTSQCRSRIAPAGATRIAATLIASTLVIAPAAAHHAMGMATPTTAWQGLLSGLAHPVIGVDHLAFIIAIGIVGSLLQRTATAAASFVIATLAGAVIHLAGINLPYAEVLIAGSVIAAATLILTVQDKSGSRLATGIVMALAMAGIFHGYAYGESIVGAEATPLWSYLTGFAGIQFMIAMAAGALYQTLATGRILSAAALTTRRTAGTAIALVGIMSMVNLT